MNIDYRGFANIILKEEFQGLENLVYDRAGITFIKEKIIRIDGMLDLLYELKLITKFEINQLRNDIEIIKNKYRG